MTKERSWQEPSRTGLLTKSRRSSEKLCPRVRRRWHRLLRDTTWNVTCQSRKRVRPQVSQARKSLSARRYPPGSRTLARNSRAHIISPAASCGSHIATLYLSPLAAARSIILRPAAWLFAYIRALSIVSSRYV